MAAFFPGSKVRSINDKPVNLTVADLVDDLEAVYKVDTSARGQAEREQWRKNKAYVDVMLQSKHLMKDEP